MSFRVIHGTFHVVGYSPDGDSVRFKPDQPALLHTLTGSPAKINARGHAQLRLEAIDTLETHFEGQHQPAEWADKALTALMAKLGIEGLEWDPHHKAVTAAQDGTAGCILAREVEKNGRPVAFVYPGKPPWVDGSDVDLHGGSPRPGVTGPAVDVTASLNAAMLADGLAYPTYYQSLFADLRDALTTIVKTARQDGVPPAQRQPMGLWRDDRTCSGVTIDHLSAITDEAVILPKLFRRLVSYLAGGGSGLGGFKSYLAAHADQVIVIQTTHTTHLDNLIDVSGNTVKLTMQPDDLVFVG